MSSHDRIIGLTMAVLIAISSALIIGMCSDEESEAVTDLGNWNPLDKDGGSPTAAYSYISTNADKIYNSGVRTIYLLQGGGFSIQEWGSDTIFFVGSYDGGFGIQRGPYSDLGDGTRSIYANDIQKLGTLNISFAEDIIQNDNLLEFCMEVSFNADEVFGTDVCTSENDDWLNIYANYDLDARRVCDTLEVYLQRGNGDEEAFKYRLSAEEQALLLPKMNTYCQEHWGQSLEECSADYLAEQSQELPEMQM